MNGDETVSIKQSMAASPCVRIVAIKIRGILTNERYPFYFKVQVSEQSERIQLHWIIYFFVWSFMCIKWTLKLTQLVVRLQFQYDLGL
ncbi:hypothetical protein Sps_04067 [Shewanella psychrophila]|uniref:Uncharacterized protein n=1 Tax=Shewanella psychrophila TaxID=225848 RepID=A0A1S6HUM6_9GAMM|nr:hypothetical protein Sps_04067 [Shewanella psychrophila]